MGSLFKRNRRKTTRSGIAIRFLLIPLLLLMAILINRFWLLPHIDTHVFRGVPNFYTWIALWNCHQVETLDFSRYWTGNAMYPTPLAFALSENMMGITPFALPIWMLTGNPVLTANLLSLLLLWLTSIITYAVVRKMVGSTSPAVIAALIFSLYPWSLKAFSLGRFHMLGLMWLPAIIYANWKFWESGRKKYLWMMGLLWLWTFLISLYLGIFLGVILGIWNFIWFFYQKKSFTGKKILMWVVVVILVWSVMAPIFLTYQKVARDTGMTRTLENQIQYTGPVWSWMKVSDENWLWGRALPFLPTGSRDGIIEDYMFPGFIVLGFFVLAFFVRTLPRWLKSLRLTGFILFLCAMGPTTLGIPWKIPLPFNLLWYVYPPLQATRNPHRLSLFVILIIAIMAAYMVKRIDMRKSMKMLLVILLGAGIVLESQSLVKPGRALRPEAKHFYGKLKKEGRPLTIMELPVNIHTDIRAMVSSCYHWNRLINGVSGVWPPMQSQLEEEMRQFPNTHAVRLLQSLEVDRIVIHEAQYGTKRKQMIRKLQEYPEIQFISREGMLSLWSLEPGPVRREFSGARDLILSCPSRGIAGKINLSLKAETAGAGFLFNTKAPSRFSFTPSRLWRIRARIQGSQRLLAQEDWRAPAMFHLYNRSRKIGVDLPPGRHQLVIEVDIMGERIRILRMLPVVPDQNLELDLPAVFKLPPGYTTIPGQELQIGITAMNVAEPMGPEGFLSLEARILNPGPFYWECGAGEGVCLGVGEEDEGRTSIHCFDLPRDLFPGDEVMVPVRLFLPRGMDSAAFYLNGAIRPGGKNERWFPEFNRVVIPNYPDK